MTALRIAHVITGLGLGGAEIMLDRVISAFDTQRVQSQVICLAGHGPVADRIRAQAVPVQVLGLSSSPLAVGGVVRLANRLREMRPDVIHTWMYHADLLGGFAGNALGIPVVWALHATSLDQDQTKRSTRLLIQALAGLSRIVPARIVSCSVVGRELHRRRGYPDNRLLVIPNGFDPSKFRPDAELRRSARASWGFGDDEIVVGHVARFHPQKDHHNLFEAAGLAHRADPRLRFICLGTDITPTNRQLVAWAEQAGVSSVCRLGGPQAHVQKLLPGMDLLVSSSRFGEAFPLVIGEAMACAVPCVVTDVGDSASMVGDTGRVVPPAAPQALAEALLYLASLEPTEREQLGLRARQRVARQYSLTRVAELYTNLYENVALRRNS